MIEVLQGLSCWHVSVGGVTAPSFTLVLGERVPRKYPLRNPAQPEAFRTHRGAVELLVWCSWRLERPGRPPLTSRSPEAAMSELCELVGTRIVSAEARPRSWDIELGFSNGMQLSVVGDSGASPDREGEDWELYLPDKTIRVGPGAQCVESPPVEL